MAVDIKGKKVSLKVILTFFLSLVLLAGGFGGSTYVHNNSEATIESELSDIVTIFSASLSRDVRYDFIKGDHDEIAKSLKTALQGTDALLDSIPVSPRQTTDLGRINAFGN